MLGRYWIAPAALFVLQNAPVAIVTDPRDGLRLAIGGALGSYEEQSVDCAGEVVARERRKFRSAGVDASGRVSPNIRITGHAGHMWTDSGSGTNLAPPFEGFYGGAMAGLDILKLALGLGLSAAPGKIDETGQSLSSRILPMGYVRLGELDRLHFRVDVGGPPAPGAPPELGRVGLGYRLGEGRRVGFRLDLGVSDFPLGEGENNLLMDVLVLIPVSRSLDLGMLGTLRDPAGGNFGLFGQVRRR